MSEIAPAYTRFVLPARIVTRSDVSRLVAEAERIDSEIMTMMARAKAGSTLPADLNMSEQFTEFVSQNAIDLRDTQIRQELIKQLRLLRDEAPVLHMTFAVDADQDSLRQLAQWARGSVHPQALLAVGLQPSLVAGVYVRTTNHVLDLSMRSRLTVGRGMLVQELERLRGSN